MDSEAKQRDPLQTGISSCAISLRCDFPTVVSLFGQGAWDSPWELPPGEGGHRGSWGGIDSPSNPNPGVWGCDSRAWGTSLFSFHGFNDREGIASFSPLNMENESYQKHRTKYLWELVGYLRFIMSIWHFLQRHHHQVLKEELSSRVEDRAPLPQLPLWYPRGGVF